jgi:hypothetical protein
MAACPIPKSVAAATKVLEEYADLSARIVALDEDRQRSIAAANQRADVAAEPMLKRQEIILAALESWWPSAALAIANGKKSVQLGGCMIGTRLSRKARARSRTTTKLAALFKTRHFKHATKLKYSLDRTSTLKLLQLGGKTAGQDRGDRLQDRDQDETGSSWSVRNRPARSHSEAARLPARRGAGQRSQPSHRAQG